MRVIIKQHPGTGLWVTSDGRVIMPPDGHRFFKFRFTFGCKDKKGYMVVRFHGKRHYVHRLVAETFHGLAPDDKPTCDHINRIRDCNVPENLRWCSSKEQADNTHSVDNSLSRYGVRECEDPTGYKRARYANDPEFVERKKARDREYESKQRDSGKRRRRCPDGKRRWLTDAEFNARFGSNQQIPLF